MKNSNTDDVLHQARKYVEDGDFLRARKLLANMHAKANSDELIKIKNFKKKFFIFDFVNIAVSIFALIILFIVSALTLFH